MEIYGARKYPIHGRVWVSENRVESDGLTRIVDLYNLDPNAQELNGGLVKVDGMFKLHGDFVSNPFQEGRESEFVTRDSFDQVMLYHTLDRAQNHLRSLGINIRDIVRKGHDGELKPMNAHANSFEDLNAYYSRQDDGLFFGTNGNARKHQDKWHLAADGDVPVHESGHYDLDMLNHTLIEGSRGDGGAIHEGFGDLFASLTFDDPEMSEEFSRQIGQVESKKTGLRDVSKFFAVGDVSNEEHDKGQVFGSFGWAVKCAIMEKFGLASRDAADLSLILLFGHATQYLNASPTFKDTIDAYLAAVDTLDKNTEWLKRNGVDAEQLKSIILAEADKRKMRTVEKKKKNEDTAWPNSATLADVERSGEYRFVLDKTTQLFGHTQEIWKQQYRIASGEYVDMVGQYAFVNDKVVSLGSVTKIEAGSINETPAISGDAARRAALGHVKQELGRLHHKALFMRMGKGSVDAETAMQYRIYETAMQRLSSSNMGLVEDKGKLVILPGSNELSYELKVGLAIIYVNAQTGEVTVKNDAFIDSYKM